MSRDFVTYILPNTWFSMNIKFLLILETLFLAFAVVLSPTANEQLWPT